MTQTVKMNEIFSPAALASQVLFQLAKILLFYSSIHELDIVGSMDQESSQQLQMWFSEDFFAPKLAGLFVTPIVSATFEQIWREKMSENHIPFDF